MGHTRIIFLLLPALFIAFQVNPSGYGQSYIPPITVRIRDGITGKPIPHFELFVGLGVYKADGHGTVMLTMPNGVDSLELHGGSHTIRCQKDYTSIFLIQQVLKEGAIGENSCGSFRNEKIKPGEIIFYSHKLNWFQSLLE